jgi:hypothetical protein
MAELNLTMLIAVLIGIHCFGDADYHRQIRIDLLTDGKGYVGTMAVRRVENRFVLLQQEEDGFVEIGTLSQVEGGKLAFEPGLDNPEFHFSLADFVLDFEELDLRTAERANFKARGNDESLEFRFNRSGDVIYIREVGSKETLCIHTAVSGSRPGSREAGQDTPLAR